MRSFLWRVLFFALLSQLSAHALAISINSTTTNSGDGNYTIDWSGFSPSSVFGVHLYENNVRIGGGSGTSGSHTFTNKANGTYTYYANGCGHGCVPSSSITVVVNKIAKPTQTPSISTSESHSTDGNFTLTAGSVSGATGYRWQRKSNSSTWTTSGRTANVSGLRNGVYEYRVQGYNSAGSGPYSGYVKVTVDRDIQPSITRSTASSSTGTYSFSWSKGAINGESPTHVWLYENSTPTIVYGKAHTSSGTTNANPKSVTVTTEGTRNYYVKACVNVSYDPQDGEAMIPSSSHCLVSTTTSVKYEFPRPGTVGGLSFTDREGTYDTDANIDIKWNSVSHADYYELRWGKKNTSKTTTSNITTLSKTNFAEFTDGEWEFQVRACNNANNETKCSSSWSSTLSEIVRKQPNAPQAVSGKHTFTDYDGVFRLDWQAPTGNANVTQYQWAAKGSSSFTAVGTQLNSANISKNNGTYEYNVRACNQNVCGSSLAIKVTVDKNVAPTISTDETSSQDGEYAFTWGAGRMLGKTPQHIFIYEDSTYYVVKGKKHINDTAVNLSAYTFKPSTQGTRTYSIKACSDLQYEGNSGYVIIREDNCANASSVNVQFDMPPPNAVSLRFNNAGTDLDTDGTFSLVWDAVAYADEYKVEYGLNAYTDTRTNTDRSEDFSNLAAGNWLFKVTSCNKFGECEKVATTSMQVLYTPSKVEGVSTQGRFIFTPSFTLNWHSVPEAIDGYSWRIRKASEAWGKFSHENNAPLQTNTSLTLTLGNGHYQIEIAACNRAGCGSASDAIDITVIVSGDVSTNYQYDALGRLTHVKLNDVDKQVFEYDAAGNRKEKTEQ